MKNLRFFPVFLAGVFAHVQIALATPATLAEVFASRVGMSQTVSELVAAMDLPAQTGGDLMKTIRRRKAEHLALPKIEAKGDIVMVKSDAGGTPLRLEILDAAAGRFKVNGQSFTVNADWTAEQILARLERLVRGDRTISWWDLAVPRAEAAAVLVYLIAILIGLVGAIAWAKGTFSGDLAAKIIKAAEAPGLKIRLKEFSCASGKLDSFAIEREGDEASSQSVKFDYETYNSGNMHYAMGDNKCVLAWSGKNYQISSAWAPEASPAANEFCEGLVKDAKGSFVSAKQMNLFVGAGLEKLQECAADKKCCDKISRHIQKSASLSNPGGSGAGTK